MDDAANKTIHSVSPAGAPPPPPAYWQVAAGNADTRDFTHAFLKFGLAFVGDRGYATMDKVRAGDRIILKQGKSAIAAVGRVVDRDGQCRGRGDKAWLNDFDGWVLEAYCHVDWHVPTKPISVEGLTRGTMTSLHVPAVRELAERVLKEVPPLGVRTAEPRPTRRITDEEILDFLIKRGLRPAAADDLTTALRRIRLMANYYYKECDWEDVREHETRTFLILPLLLALGWPEQRLKIELGAPGQKRIDVACFAKPYQRNDEHEPNNQDCLVILESKGFEHGLDQAPAQARGYAEHFPACRCVIVSNGYCYKAYRRDPGSGAFSMIPTAYLNVLNPQDRYPLDPENIKGALDVLDAIMPPE
jgi:hypothetical protein